MMKIERETIINFNDEEGEAEIYSCQPKIWRRCEKLGLEPKRVVKNLEGEVISKTYSCPKKWIKINKTQKRILTDEQKAIMSDRMKSIQNRKFNHVS